MLSLQHDTGRWCTEYTWSADDGMFGMRVLRNFGRLQADVEETAEERPWRTDGRKRVDEEEAMEGGLKGRLSAGAEIYFSAKEKSAGGECSYIDLISYLISVFSLHRNPIYNSTRRNAAIAKLTFT